jgi:hypothetical protein
MSVLQADGLGLAWWQGEGKGGEAAEAEEKP